MFMESEEEKWFICKQKSLCDRGKFYAKLFCFLKIKENQYM